MAIRDQARASLLARAFSYPYSAPSSPVLFYRGRQWQPESIYVDVDRDGFAHVAANGSAHGPCLPLLAVGSNADPTVLRRKFGSGAVSILQGPMSLPGFAAAHSAHIARYGAVPATLTEADTVLETHLQFVPLKQLAALDASEAAGVNYERVRLPVGGLRARWLPSDVQRKISHIWTYRSLHGVAKRDGQIMFLGRQRDALAHAADRAGWRLSLEAFVVMLVRDASFRQVVSAALKEA